MTPAAQIIALLAAFWGIAFIFGAAGFFIGRYTKIVPWDEETWS